MKNKIRKKNKLRRIQKIIPLLLAGMLLPLLVAAQIQRKGTPASWNFQNKETTPVVRLKATQPVKQLNVQKNSTAAPQPLAAGYIVPFDSLLLQQGIWQQLPDGTWAWKLTVHLKGSGAMNFYFSHLNFHPDDKLFLYTTDRRQLLGAFGTWDSTSRMGTAYLQDSIVTVEFDARERYDQLPFLITGVGNITQPSEKSLKDFGDAGSCEIPVNCPEGKEYQNQKNGVARILLRDGNSLYWCTGSLINDTRNDGTPYFLTANHCGSSSSASDYAQWVFYFNYESPDCSRPTTAPAIHALSGAKLLASADYNTGSDFKLLLLNSKVPYDYKPYFNGWNRSGDISDSGVVIHHPEGDIKMISTYKTPTRPVDYYGSTTDPNADFWEVHWATTVSGHGVTEGGSSGSPLFDPNKLIIGTLTGGDAACSAPDAPDYFGRFSKHWDAGGTDSTRQLKYWLDKAQTGIVEMTGYDPLSTAAIANFSSDVKKTPIGGTIRFVDLSTGPVTGYHWEFEGGEPATYDSKTPPSIQYPHMGTFQVKLTVTSAAGTNTKIDSVFVLPVIYPNPVKDGKIYILLGSYQPEDISIEVFDMLGRKVNIFKPQFGTDHVSLLLPHNQNGLYIIRLTNKNSVNTFKVINFHL
ncbi:T9SS type A sorting domain-containing protein [Candidatus Sulfidibacterium hydrothermale]|uniref:T9SS type A sorting domain-containing protein n=1 Tax=Candidatus Sulfidibacterium hydrothermale TaxID=2875962 RepID=UPI001F0ADF1F|nr:T9SS type A sorting domain-containing protein [Candidatus Sulfidibacterium hydrothermale]UBM62032.1 T9SS type A sorting domain-containing protein [Candidatus Sulfidibacterium hydrothermale]